MVIGETAAAAQDAAELVAVDYEELDAGHRCASGRARGRAASYPDAPGNIAIDWAGPAADADANARAVEQVISARAHGGAGVASSISAWW